MKNELRSFISTFDTFEPDEIDAIVDNTHVESHKKGTLLLNEGDVCKKCYFILKGCVRQFQIVDGDERTTAFFTEGEAVVLYSSYMDKAPSKHYLSCIEDCILTAGTREQEIELHEKYPKLKYLVHTLIPQDYSKIEWRLSFLANNSPESRYLILLENEPELVNRVPLHQLASYIGVTPESFSRIRKRILLKEKNV